MLIDLEVVELRASCQFSMRPANDPYDGEYCAVDSLYSIPLRGRHDQAPWQNPDRSPLPTREIIQPAYPQPR